MMHRQAVFGADVAQLVQEDKVHRRLYTDPAIFDLEMQLLFEQTWVFIGHESEVAAPGDYRTAYIGRQPVIMSRHRDGKVYVMHNRCMHRGAVVCREEKGNSSSFRCIYHGWTYNNGGELVGLPYRSGYGEDFDQSCFNLLQVPRVGSYRGFVFASLSPTGISLDEYLGRAKFYIDLIVDAAPDGEIAVNAGVQKYSYPGNWKYQIENWVDGYHPNFTHQTAYESIRRREGRKVGSFEGSVASASSFGHGHGLLDYSGTGRGYFSTSPGYGEYCDRLEERLGEARAKEVLERDVQILCFPNLWFQNARLHFRVVRPISVDMTEVYAYPYTLKGAPDSINNGLSKHLSWWASSSGFGQPDDLEAFVRCQEGLQVTGAEWVDFSRGKHREKVSAEGETVGDVTDEIPQRGIYREYKRLMAAGEPATAGTR